MIDAVAPDRAHQVHAHRVAAEREEQAVAEAQDAGVAPDQVHRERDHRVAHDFADERDEIIREIEDAVFRHDEVQQREHHQHDDHERKDRRPAFGTV